MRMILKWKMDLGPLKNIANELKSRGRELVVETAQKVLIDIKNWAPKDTGALSAGYYLVSRNIDGGPSAMSEAIQLNPDGQTLPLIGIPQSDYLAAIGSVMSYWEYVENGTGHGPAQPHIEPAFQAHANEIRNALGMLADNAAKAAGWS